MVYNIFPGGNNLCANLIVITLLSEFLNSGQMTTASTHLENPDPVASGTLGSTVSIIHPVWILEDKCILESFYNSKHSFMSN